MVVRHRGDREARYDGLRMTADEYMDLPVDTECRYELIEGVVTMTPRPGIEHQDCGAEIIVQIGSYLRQNPIGRVLGEFDVKVSDDTVYRPDVVFLTTEKVKRVRAGDRVAPDIAVEVISASSRTRDSVTKRVGYEAAGVGEYWIIDTERNAFTFLVLEAGQYREVEAAADRYAATILPGFELDLALVRACF